MRVLFADDLITLEYPEEMEVQLIHVKTPEKAIHRLQDSRQHRLHTDTLKPSRTPFHAVFLGNSDMVPVAKWLREHDYPATIFVHSSVEEDRNRLMNEFKGFRHRVTDKQGRLLRYYSRARTIDLSADLNGDVKVKRVGKIASSEISQPQRTEFARKDK